MRTHLLKCWPEPFAEMKAWRKRFEFRRDDRGYMVDDVLVLQEWDPGRIGSAQYSSPYTPAVPLRMRVTYVLYGGRFGVPEGYCVMSLEPEPST